MIEALILAGITLVAVPLVAVAVVRDAATHRRLEAKRAELARQQRRQASFDAVAKAFVDGLGGAARAAAEVLTQFAAAIRAVIDTPIYEQVQKDYALVGLGEPSWTEPGETKPNTTTVITKESHGG